MKVLRSGICAALAACAGMVCAEPAHPPAPVWDLAKDAFAATTGKIERADGRVVMDGASAFAIPNSAVQDASCFTIVMEIRFRELEERSNLGLLDERVSETGFAVDALKWGAVGSPLVTTVNGIAYGQNGFRASSNQVWQFVFAVRDGVVTPYQNKVPGPQYLLRITPNLAPIWVGRTSVRKDMKPISNYEILSLKVYGPDYKYYQPGESADTLKNGYVGGQGWLVRLPGKTDKPLPRILYYGDSISMGYGDRFAALMKDKAYCYHWCHFVGGVDHFPSAAFEAAAGVAPFDVIVFNNGLHSLHWSPEKVTDAQIEDVLRNMVRAFRKGAPKARLIWAATTPHTAKGRPVAGVGELNLVVLRINTLAEKVMKDEGVESVDLYALLKGRLDLAAGDQYHWSGDAYQLIAAALQKKCDEVLFKK
ncbi:MAG TPA: SGNH/GDSL hydrolase family protein [Kiritimatiellia bacterium]|nr:SGNH/GDSL hydrolase family protein [Kiritimatiellia bacterium]HPS06532.1 SGNH/GDSL hydrolase family protein [Kiritimatiellia bacterium]